MVLGTQRTDIYDLLQYLKGSSCSLVFSQFTLKKKNKPIYFVLGYSETEVKSLSRVRLFATSWIIAYQGPPSIGFSRQEYWSGLPLPSLICVSNAFQSFC